MSNKSKSGDISTEKLRMVSGVLLDTPKPFHIQPRLPFTTFNGKVMFLQFFQLAAPTWTGYNAEAASHPKRHREGGGADEGYEQQPPHLSSPREAIYFIFMVCIYI